MFDWARRFRGGTFIMSNAVQFHQATNILPVPESSDLRRRRQAERNIESRLRALGHAIRDLEEAPYPSLLRDRACVKEALEELAVKEVTLQWIVRITRCTEGAVREKLWSDIQDALTDLEKLAESVRQTGRPGSTVTFRPRKVSCPGTR
jgi:hypothetical protein